MRFKLNITIFRRGCKCKPTSVVVVPAAGVVVLKNLRRAPGFQQVVHLVLLPPGQRLAQDLPCFVDVEVSGPQEAQDVLVFRDLDTGRRDGYVTQ